MGRAFLLVSSTPPCYISSMSRHWINIILFITLILLAIAINFDMGSIGAALAVGIATAAFITNATISIARAMTQRDVFGHSMWAIAFLCILGLLLSGTLIKERTSFDEEIWASYISNDESGVTIKELRGIALGKTKSLTDTWTIASAEAQLASFVAVEYENTAFLNHVIKSGFNKDAQLDGQTMLAAAIISGKPKSAEVLLELGLEPNQLGEDDMTPLMHASLNGDIECITLLKKFGAKSDMKNRNGLDARSYAQNGRMLQLFEN